MTTTPPPDPASTIRSKQFVVLLVLAAIVGVVASVAAWGFLEGLATGLTRPVELPEVMLAAVASIGLGVVLGPESAGASERPCDDRGTSARTSRPWATLSGDVGSRDVVTVAPTLQSLGEIGSRRITPSG
jgi:hypothetical protein